MLFDMKKSVVVFSFVNNEMKKFSLQKGISMLFC